jgi:gluconolactonase
MLVGTALSYVLFRMMGVASAEMCSPPDEGHCDADTEFHLSSSDDDMAALQARSSLRSRQALESQSSECFKGISPEFLAIVDGNQCPKVLANKTYDFAHEGPVYLKNQNSVIFSSNRLGDTSGPSQYIEISQVDLDTGVVMTLPEAVWLKGIIMANGAYPDPQDPDAVLWLAQGNMSRPSGVFRLNTIDFTVETVIDTSSVEEFDGASWSTDPMAQFNSPNDIVVDARSGALLFTDPIYGFVQKFRPDPQLGNTVWIYRAGDDLPNISSAAATVADGFSRPNGIAFDNDYSHVYVTDTGYFPGADSVTTITLNNYVGTMDTDDPAKLLSSYDPLMPRSIYRFDVDRDESGKILTLSNRELFASSHSGIPDGIKIDCEGRVYTGVAGGVDVYTLDGQLLGKISVDYGVANFVLVPRGEQTELVMLAETVIYSVMLNTKTCKH